MEARNHPAGNLAEYWLQELKDEWNQGQNGWRGLHPPISDQLKSMLASNDIRGEMVAVILASELQFIYEADSTWCKSHLLPLLRWNDGHDVSRVWDGFLSNPRWTDQLLRAGLLEQMLKAVEHRTRFEKIRGNRLLQQLAAIALKSDDDPIAWIPRFVRNSSLSDRVQWAEHVANQLSSMTSDAAEQQWARWIHSYWKDRVESVPRRMNPEEASAMACWVAYLGASISQGVDLVTRYPAGFTSQTLFFRDLSEERIGAAPDEFARMIAHLLSRTELPFYSGYGLPKVFGILAGQGASEQSMNLIAQQATRLGISLPES
jgi:uncharacterized protein DUF4020